MATWSSGVVSAEEIGAMGRDIESLKGKGWWLFINNCQEIAIYIKIFLLEAFGDKKYDQFSWVHKVFLRNRRPYQRKGKKPIFPPT
jgi:hypothetical protein